MITILGRPHNIDEALAWFRSVSATGAGLQPYHDDAGDLLARAEEAG